jgi:type IV pilus assembly protein PilA
MKPEVTAKFLQHLNRKNKDGGFTLIELLVVIIIIGILSAIALPSFLNQANKGKQSEAKQYVGSLNRSQQAYLLEKGTFSADLSLLGVGIKTTTTNYNYTAAVAAPGAYNSGTAIDVKLKSYAGVVATLQDTTTSDVTSIAALYESKAPGEPAVVTGADTTLANFGNWTAIK